MQMVLSAKANDDRPASPQPAIASPVAAPLTIESLAGTYTPDDEERWVAARLEEMQKDGLDDATLKSNENTSKAVVHHKQSHNRRRWEV